MTFTRGESAKFALRRGNSCRQRCSPTVNPPIIRMYLRLLLPLAVCGGLCLFSACRNDQSKAPNPLGQFNDPGLARLTVQLEEQPDNDSLLFERALLFHELDGYDEALADLSRAIQLDSMQPQYYHLLADVYLDYARPNDSRRAIDVLETAAARFPDHTHTLLKLSEFQLIVAQHSAALQTIDRILRRDPQSAEAFFMTGRVALDMKDTARAMVAFRKSVQLDAGNVDAWLFLARIAALRNDPQTLQYLDNALRVDSSNLEAREQKGIYYKLRGRFDDAFAVYRDIIQRNPDYSNAYFDMGMIYLELDSLQKAYDHFDFAIKTDPLFVKAYYYRGVASEAAGNTDAALADYVQANKMSPDYPEAKEARARLEKK
jgi:tetratricopeptide (TPR) repeat protein